jgi:hypothetical protein
VCKGQSKGIFTGLARGDDEATVIAGFNLTKATEEKNLETLLAPRLATLTRAKRSRSRKNELKREVAQGSGTMEKTEVYLILSLQCVARHVTGEISGQQLLTPHGIRFYLK